MRGLTYLTVTNTTRSALQGLSLNEVTVVCCKVTIVVEQLSAVHQYLFSLPEVYIDIIAQTHSGVASVI